MSLPVLTHPTEHLFWVTTPNLSSDLTGLCSDLTGLFSEQRDQNEKKGRCWLSKYNTGNSSPIQMKAQRQCPCPKVDTGYTQRRNHDPVSCPKCPSLGTRLGRGHTEPPNAQGPNVRSASITLMPTDTLVRVVTGQGYVSVKTRTASTVSLLNPG